MDGIFHSGTEKKKSWNRIQNFVTAATNPWRCASLLQTFEWLFVRGNHLVACQFAATRGSGEGGWRRHVVKKKKIIWNVTQSVARRDEKNLSAFRTEKTIYLCVGLSARKWRKKGLTLSLSRSWESWLKLKSIYGKIFILGLNKDILGNLYMKEPQSSANRNMNYEGRSESNASYLFPWKLQ